MPAASGARLKRLELGIPGMPAHELPAAGQQRRVGVHCVGVDGEQNIDLAEELARLKVAKHSGGRHSAQRTRTRAPAGGLPAAARRVDCQTPSIDSNAAANE